MDRNFLKQSIRRELDYYKDGLFNEDEDEYWSVHGRRRTMMTAWQKTAFSM